MAAIATCKNYWSFNTSHVTLYRSLAILHASLVFPFQYISCYSLSGPMGRRVARLAVSIHLMLLFIREHIAEEARNNSFNTSHVTLYLAVLTVSAYQSSFQYISCYSLSDPLLFLYQFLRPFQYISCYSLSLTTWFQTGDFHSFNTSHVTLYLAQKRMFTMKIVFQYISCYSLSLYHLLLCTPI